MKIVPAFIVLMIAAAVVMAQPPQNRFKETTTATEEVATRYFYAYMALDWNKLEPLMHADITFEDPTGTLLFGENRPAGKSDVIGGFRTGLAALTHMTPKIRRKFFSGTAGVFEMDLTFGFRNRQNQEVNITMPLVVVLKVKDGKVIEHRDYGGYRDYVKQVAAASKAASAS